MFALALRLARRDWRAGELTVLAVSVVLAVACVTSVAFFVERVGSALKQQASELMAADLRLGSDRALAQAFADKATQLKLEQARSVSFRSMSQYGDKVQLAELKAVSDSYPLRGFYRIADRPFVPGEVVRHGPARGEVWVEAGLLSLLGAKVQDSIRLGNQTFVIAHIIAHEPDRSSSLFSIAPRILFNLNDLPDTGLIQEGSRVRYHFLLAGERSAINEYRRWVKPKLDGNQSLETVEDARQEVKIALDRASQFLGLAAVVGVVVAFIAVAMAAQRYSERHLNYYAMMRCLGSSHRKVLSLFIYQLSVIAVLASVLGVAIGYLAHLFLVQTLGRLLLVQLPDASWLPVASGLLIGVVGMLAFALPAVLKLREVPILHVIRRQVMRLKPAAVPAYFFGVAVVVSLVFVYVQDVKLALIILLGLVLTFFLLGLVSWLLLLLLQSLNTSSRFAWRFNVRNLTRRKKSTVIQILALGIGLMVLLLLSVIRNDLLDVWQQGIPTDAPNRFLINIQPGQIQQVAAFLTERQLPEASLFPMVRARLKKINERNIDTEEQTDARAQRLAHRSFNLSWAQTMQADNELVAGQWWGQQDSYEPQFSVEQGIARTLDIKMGDVLEFEMAGETIRAPVTNMRTVDWSSFNANFFVVATPGLLDHGPATYFTSLYVPDEQADALNALVKTFPNITIIDVSVIMNQVREIIDKVSLAVEFVFVFTLLAGVAVLYATIQTTQDERVRENAVLRSLGARRGQLLKGLFLEFMVLGALAGCVAVVLAHQTGYMIAHYVLKLSYHPSVWLWIIGLCVGVFGVGIAGLLGTRKVLRKPPLQVLSG